MADPRMKQLTIKTGVVKRLTKEKTVYEKEVLAQKNRLERLKTEGKDDYVLRKEQEVLQECLMMVPDCQRRLAKAFEELNEFINVEDDLRETKEFENALNVIKEAKPQLP